MNQKEKIPEKIPEKIATEHLLLSKGDCRNPPVWKMLETPYSLIHLLEHYDVKSALGKKLNILLMEYEGECAQAKIKLINATKKLLMKPKK